MCLKGIQRPFNDDESFWHGHCNYYNGSNLVDKEAGDEI